MNLQFPERSIVQSKTKGGVSVMEKWEYNNAKNKYMKNWRK